MPTAASAEDRTPPARQSRMGTWGGFFIITIATAVIGLLEVLARDSVGVFTGVAFIAASAIVAATIRPADLWTAVISPPLAYLVALIIASQPEAIGKSGNLWLHEATAVLTGLAFNAPWVFVGTGIALIIVLVRRSHLRRAEQSLAVEYHDDADGAPAQFNESSRLGPSGEPNDHHDGPAPHDWR